MTINRLNTKIRVMVTRDDDPSQVKKRWRAVCMNSEDFMVSATGFHVQRALERLQWKVKEWSIFSGMRIVNFDDLDDSVKKSMIDDAHEEAIEIKVNNKWDGMF